MSSKKTRTFQVEIYEIKKGRQVHTGSISITRYGNTACAAGSKRARAAAQALFNLPILDISTKRTRRN